MRTWFSIAVTLLVWVGTARAQRAMFEDLRADAQKVDDLPEVVRPYIEPCNDKDDEARRQCEGSRRFLQDHLRTVRMTMLIDKALDVQSYQGKSKSVPVTVRGCVTCEPLGIDVDGQKVWIGVGPKAEVAKRQIPVAIEKIKEWQQLVAPQLRTEMIFGLANKAVAGAPAGAKSLAVEIIGWRVFNRCTGEVLFSEPSSKDKAEVTGEAKAECPTPEEPPKVAAQPTAPDHRPPRLGRYEIEQALAVMKPKIKACYDQYEVAGRADVVLDIQNDGILQAAHVKGTFEGTPTANCLLQALDGVKFPAFKSRKQTVEYPFYLR
jgi:hypothetical protein